MGFVFQSFNLIPVFTALENVELPLLVIGMKGKPARERATLLLERVGLGERLDHRPAELSGGEQQRVAIARALVAEPAIVWADEPTGNLDSQTASAVIDLLLEVHAAGWTVVLVTHDRTIGEHGDRVLQVRDGLITVDGPPAVALGSRTRAVLVAFAAGRLALMRPGLFVVLVRLACRNALRRKGEALARRARVAARHGDHHVVLRRGRHAPRHDSRSGEHPARPHRRDRAGARPLPARSRVAADHGHAAAGHGRRVVGGDGQRRRRHGVGLVRPEAGGARRVHPGGRLRCRPRVRRQRG